MVARHRQVVYPDCNHGCDSRGTVSAMPRGDGNEEWILLSYRLPREPSTPRSSVWRTLKRLGVAQLGDGLVALPADARTREALEWVAEEVTDHGGEAVLWLGRPLDQASQRGVTEKMTEAIRAEYLAVIAEAEDAVGTDSLESRRRAARLTRELERIGMRDYFAAAERADAQAAVEALIARPSQARARNRG